MITRRRTFTLGMVSSKPRLTSARLEVIEGQLPRRALNLVQEWAMIHNDT